MAEELFGVRRGPGEVGEQPYLSQHATLPGTSHHGGPSRFTQAGGELWAPPDPASSVLEGLVFETWTNYHKWWVKFGPPELSPTRVSRRPLLEAMVDICRELQPGWRTFPKVMNELPISGGIQK